VAVERIVSGGQTGVDRAALDVALRLGIPCGGRCPRGRRAEDGRIPGRYPLRETWSRTYAWRTWLNVRSADAALILSRGAPTGGTGLTWRCCRLLGRPHLLLDLAAPEAAAEIRAWLAATGARVLNVAGPRESAAPGIAAEAAALLEAVLAGD